MRACIVSLTLASCILCTTALNLVQKRDGEAPRVVQHKIQRRHLSNPIQHDQNRRRRRRDTVSASLTNEETLYFIDVSVGTPRQDVKLHIDTGSSDLWVNVADSKLCKESSKPCASSGTYSANASSTYTYLDSDFNITYVDGSGAVGDYAEDVVRFSDVKLKNQIFGIGYESTSTEGILGIGYPENEVAVSEGFESYPNVPQNLADKGYINTNAYSLWLDDLDSSTGSILFGGVNTAKYTGDLETLPILKTDGVVYADFLIALTDIGVNGEKASIVKNLDYPALLDSGTSLMYLPDDAVKKIFKEFNVQYDESIGAGIVDCSLADSDKSVDFTFSSPTIKVALSEIILSQGDNTCIFGIGLAGDSTPVLGDTFLRSAYVVYDVSSNEISLAQADFSSTSNNIVEISGSSIPSATIVSDPVTSVAQVSDASISVGSVSASGTPNAAAPTATVGYNVALLGAAGAALLAL